MKTTMLGGLIFLAPIAVIALLLGKAYQLSLAVARPVDKLIPIETVAGVAFVNILAILLIIALCYLAGLLAKSAKGIARIDKVDGILTDVIPTYAIFKNMVGSYAQHKDLPAHVKPVIVKLDDYDQIAFEIERDAQEVTLFLPGSPSTWAGTTIIVAVNRVHTLNMPTHQAVKLMRVMGRGTLAAKQAASAPSPEQKLS